MRAPVASKIVVAGGAALIAEVLAPNATGSAPTALSRQVAALFYTLCESAKLTGVDPHTYLLTATEAALATPGAVTLPDALLAAVAA